MAKRLGILRASPPEISYMPEEIIARFTSGEMVIELSCGYGEYAAALEIEVRRFRAFMREREKHAVLPFNVCPHVGKPCAGLLDEPPRDH